jgi:signal transduction histidine kinase
MARLDRLLPDALRGPDADADSRRRARVVAGFAVTLGVIAVLLTAGAAAMRLWDNLPGTALGIPVALGLLWRLRRGTSLVVLGAATGLTLFVIAAQGAIALGGLGSPPVTWCYVIPLLVVLVAGPRHGLAATLVGIAIATGFYATTPAPPPITPTLRYFDGIALAAFVLALALIYERFKQRALDELATANARLAAEMRERARVEADLRLAQKLDSVGRLAAGVAHEIATPVQYVQSTTVFVRDATADVLGVLARYRELAPAGAGAELEAAADLPYLEAELPGAIDRMSAGLDRIAHIVRSMRQLVHPAQQQLVHVALDAEIANTLALAVNEYREVADLRTRYGGLPPVRCRAGEINQIVLNLVINAAHAIGDVVRATGDRGVIEVATRRDGDVVEIAVTDSGGGIPDPIRDKVFDPFFTTKEVGRGTGQGLAIARSAIERHGGTLTFETEVGRGTTFRARLPIEPPPVAVPA